jgi:hypothetical protein
MLVASFIAITLLAIWALSAVYCLSMAIAGRAAGITVERCTIGLGPSICQPSILGIPIEVKPIPSASVTFKGFGEDDLGSERPAVDNELTRRPPERSTEGARFEQEVTNHIAIHSLPTASTQQLIPFASQSCSVGRRSILFSG